MFREFVRRVGDAVGVLVADQLSELRYAARALWPFYALPARARVVRASDTIALRRLSQPYFEHVRGRLLDHDCEPGLAGARAHALLQQTLGPAAASAVAAFRARQQAQAQAQAQAKAEEGGGGIGGGAALPPVLSAGAGSTERRLEGELPFFCKYLLIAAFCAGHNPAETDVRYFARKASGRRRAEKGKRAARKAVRSALLEGPKPFALERMLAIFHALVTTNESLEQSEAVAHADLAACVAQLVGLRLLRRVLPASAKAASDAIRAGAETYSCGALTFETAAALAKNVNLELGMFLHDAA
jgi:hypothetical protein